MEQKAGTGAVLSIFAAIASYFFSFSGHPGWGMVAALAAIPLGFFGFLRSASPRVGGGLMSIIALVLAVVAIGLAVLVLIGVILF